jgi:hypothetical protein
LSGHGTICCWQLGVGQELAPPGHACTCHPHTGRASEVGSLERCLVLCSKLLGQHELLLLLLGCLLLLLLL